VNFVKFGPKKSNISPTMKFQKPYIDAYCF